MADERDPAPAPRTLPPRPDALVCDPPLDHALFAGLANLLKHARCPSWTTTHTRSTTGAGT